MTEERPVRGPHIAQLEFIKQLKEENKEGGEKIGSVIDLFNDYYQRFGNKACCMLDLKPYLGLLEQDQCETVGVTVWTRTTH